MAEGRQCLDCGGKVYPLKKHPYCQACGPHHCTSCGVRVPSTSRTSHCTACRKAAREARFQRDRPCFGCGEIMRAGRRREYCLTCTKAEYRLRRRQLLCRPDRHCLECGILLPLGRMYNRCAACHTSRRKRQLCVRCGLSLSRNDSSYCRRCTNWINNWRRAYHLGDPIARQLGTIRPYHHWQKKNAAP